MFCVEIGKMQGLHTSLLAKRYTVLQGRVCLTEPETLRRNADPKCSLVLVAGMHLRTEVTGEFVILLMSTGQFLASTFH